MSARDRRQRRALERRAQRAIEKMPQPRMGDDPAQYLLRVQRWIERTKEEAGDRALLDRIVELAGRTVEEHVARHLQASVITTRAADELMVRVGVSPETVANAHLKMHWTSPQDRSCVPLGPSGEETVVVSYSSEEARTRIWRLGEAEDDPDPDTVKGWRNGPRR